MKRLALAALLGPLALPAALAGGRIDVRVTDHRAGIEDFREVKIQVAEVALHRAGRSRSDGWVTVLRGSRPVDIVLLKDGKWESVGIARVPAGRYDAVRVLPSVREARRRDAAPASVDPSVGTVMFHDELEIKRGAMLPLLLDFYVEDQTDHAPLRYALKLRHVGLGLVRAVDRHSR